MIILDARAGVPKLLGQPPGTPIVAIDAAGVPVAIGTTLHIDPDKKAGDLKSFTDTALAHSKQLGDYATLLSTGLDIASDHLPDYAHPLSGAATAFSFVATGASLANEIDKGDTRRIAIASFKFGASALAAIDEYILPGYPALSMGAQTCKLVSSALAVTPDTVFGGGAKPAA